MPEYEHNTIVKADLEKTFSFCTIHSSEFCVYVFTFEINLKTIQIIKINQKWQKLFQKLKQLR